MSNVEKILNQAKAWIGLNEKDGSHQQIIDVYNGHKPLARGYTVKYTDNWCATFVSACAIKTNLINIIPLECSCGEMIELAKQMNIWNENDDITPKAGDIIMYDWDNQDGWPEHVGIVESVTNNQITVIEGNKNNAVGRRVISLGNASIRGYIQPNYDGSVTNNQPSKPISNEKAVNYQVKVNTKSGVNCRKEPSVSSAKITAYANGTQLTITKEKNGWGYANNTGWVSLEYCTKITQTKMLGIYEVTASDLSVRDGAGTEYRRKTYNELTANAKQHDYDRDGCLNKGTRVTVYEWKNGWARIPSGWVCGEYLKKV